MTTRKTHYVGQLQNPGGKPQNVELFVNQRPNITEKEKAKGIEWVDSNFDPGDIMRYGAKVNSDNDDQAAIQLATDLPYPVYSSKAGYTYIDSEIVLKKDADLDAYEYREIRGLKINATGATIRTVDCFTFDPAEELAGRYSFVNSIIKFANKGINKETGNLGNHFLNTTLKNCNYGYYAVESRSVANGGIGIMHTGADRFDGGEISGNRKAGVYVYNPNESVGQHLFHGTIVQDNVGHGLYFDGYNLAAQMLEINGVWFEGNGTGGALDLGFGKGSETPRDIMMHDVDHARIVGCVVTSIGMEFNNSMVTMDGCFFNAASVLVQDSDSVVRCINANLDGIDGSSNVIIESLTQQRRASGDSGAGMKAMIPDRDHIVHSLPGTGVCVFSETFADSDITLLGGSGAGTRTYSNAKGPGLYRHYNNFTFTTDAEKYYDALIPLVLNKWYVYTVSIMVASGEINTLDFYNGSFDLIKNLDSPLRDNVTDGEWITLGGVVEYTDSAGSGNVRFRTARTASTSTEVNLSATQVVQFDTQHEAIAYFNGRAFCQTQRLEYSGRATLSSGTVSVDFTTEGFQDQPDTVYNVHVSGSESVAGEVFYAGNKSTTGFDITSSAGASTNGVDWRVYRRDL